jgi:hypothetical protein
MWCGPAQASRIGVQAARGIPIVNAEEAFSEIDRQVDALSCCPLAAVSWCSDQCRPGAAAAERPTMCLDDVRAHALASGRTQICRWASRGGMPDDGLGTQTPWPGCGVRDHGGQILFVEFCDWAIKKHLFTDDDGPEPGSAAAGGEGYRPVEEMRPAAMTMHAVERRKATAAAPGQRAPAAASSPAAPASRPVEGDGGHRCGWLRPM